jgi:hypothetical protein
VISRWDAQALRPVSPSSIACGIHSTPSSVEVGDDDAREVIEPSPSDDEVSTPLPRSVCVSFDSYDELSFDVSLNSSSVPMMLVSMGHDDELGATSMLQLDSSPGKDTAASVFVNSGKQDGVEDLLSYMRNMLDRYWPALTFHVSLLFYLCSTLAKTGSFSIQENLSSCSVGATLTMLTLHWLSPRTLMRLTRSERFLRSHTCWPRAIR